MTTDTPIHNSPHDGMQLPDGSVYEPPSPPNVPQPIVTLPISGPQAASMSYGLPTSDDEEVNQLAEDDPQPALVYSRFQFMPRNTTSRTYKTIFYPNDNRPPISPWNTCTMMALTDPDHSSVYNDIRRMHFHEKCSKVDSLDMVEPGRVSRPQLFYDSSMSETVQNSPYPPSLLFSNNHFFHQCAIEIEDLLSPESNSISPEVHDHIETFTLSSFTITNEDTASPELDSLADKLNLIDLDRENGGPKVQGH